MTSPYEWNVAFSPGAELEPNTEYTFEATVYRHATAEATQISATFTTGDGPATEPPMAEGAVMEHYVVDLAGRPPSTCGGSLSGTCVVVPPGSSVTATFVDRSGREREPYLYREPFFTNLSGIDQGTPIDHQPSRDCSQHRIERRRERRLFRRFRPGPSRRVARALRGARHGRVR